MRAHTETELLDRFEYYLMQVESQLLRGDDFDSLAGDIPFAVHLNDAHTLEVKHTNSLHAELTGHPLEQIREMGMKFLEECVHPKSFELFPYIVQSVKLDPYHTFAFVQHLRLFKPKSGFSPVVTFTKPARLPNNLLVCLSPLPRDFGRMSQKIERVVEINEFKMKNLKRFQQLTSREIDVLRLLGSGYNNPQISECLSISRQTVETHRKRLKAKLELASFRDLMRYALAFELVSY